MNEPGLYDIPVGLLYTICPLCGQRIVTVDNGRGGRVVVVYEGGTLPLQGRLHSNACLISKKPTAPKWTLRAQQ